MLILYVVIVAFWNCCTLEVAYFGISVCCILVLFYLELMYLGVVVCWCCVLKTCYSIFAVCQYCLIQVSVYFDVVVFGQGQFLK